MRLSSRARLVVAIAAVALLGLLTVAAAGLPTADTAGHCNGGTWWINRTKVGIGQPMPEFGFRTCGGAEQSIADYAGTPVLVNFWATWCPPCIEELPNLAEFNEQADGEVAVLGISIDMDPEDLYSFSQKHKLGYEVAWDGGGIASDLGISSIPLTIALNADGELVGFHQGYATIDDLKQLAEKAQ